MKKNALVSLILLCACSSKDLKAESVSLPKAARPEVSSVSLSTECHNWDSTFDLSLLKSGGLIIKGVTHNGNKIRFDAPNNLIALSKIATSIHHITDECIVSLNGFDTEITGYTLSLFNNDMRLYRSGLQFTVSSTGVEFIETFCELSHSADESDKNDLNRLCDSYVRSSTSR